MIKLKSEIKDTEKLSELALSSRGLQVFLLILIIGYVSFYLYVSVSTELDISDRAQELFNAAAFSNGKVMNVDFHTLQPGAVLFQAAFVKIFPKINYLGFRIVGVFYFLVTILVINILMARIRFQIKIRSYALFMLNLSLILIPFYVCNWSFDLTYDTMPVLLITLIFYLLLKKNSRLSNFAIGLLISVAALIKVTFLLLFLAIIILKIITRDRESFKKGPWVALLGGAAFPFLGFGTYWVLNHALVPTLDMYYFASLDRFFGGKFEAFFGNLIWILPGTLFVWIIWKLFFHKKLGWLYTFAAWLAYFIFLFLTKHVLVKKFLLSYVVGTFCLGTLMFILSELKEGSLKTWLMFLLIVIGVIFPFGSANIYLPLLFPSLLLIPLIAVFMIHWNKKNVLVFSVLPFLLIPLAMQTKSRLGGFVKHKLIDRDGLYVQYSDPKLRHIYDVKNRVDDLEETTDKIREVLPERQYFLLYPRFPIYYWLIENAVPAMPKVDLETALCPEWVKYNLDYMVANNQIPNYVFEEAESEKDPVYDLLRSFIRENYRLIEKFRGYNIYKLKEESHFFQRAEER